MAGPTTTEEEQKELEMRAAYQAYVDANERKAAPVQEPVASPPPPPLDLGGRPIPTADATPAAESAAPGPPTRSVPVWAGALSTVVPGAGLIASAVGGKEESPDAGGLARDVQKSAVASSPQRGTEEGNSGERARERPAPSPAGASGPSGGSSARVIPGGLYPNEVQRQVHEGKPVSPEVRQGLATAGALDVNAAGIERDAAKDLYAHQRDLAAATMQAGADAQAQHARVELERQQIVKSKLADIERLNREAQGAPEDIWSSKQALAGMFSALAMGIGLASKSAAGAIAGATAGRLMNSFVNEDVQAKLHAQESARGQAGRQINILGLHLENLGDRDKAINATRLALYDNILQQAEMYKAQHGADVSEAGYQKFVAGVLEHRAETMRALDAQETADVHSSLSLKYHMPTVSGGSPEKKLDDLLKQLKPGNTVLIPRSDQSPGEGVRVSISDEATATRLQKVGGSIGAIYKMNNQASQLLKKRDEAFAAGEYSEYRRLNTQLEDIAENKASFGSVRNEQGVLREPEYVRAIANTVGWGSHDSLKPWAPDTVKQQQFLRAQNEQLYREFGAEVQAAGGSVVEHKFVDDPKTGLKHKVQVETGRTYDPDTVQPELTPVK